MTSIKKIGISNILNAILVNEDIRPAMLIQPADYNERTGKDKKTLAIVNGIKKLFPELLKSSDNYEIYQGTIISKKSYDTQDISLENMGNILGYPCYKDFETLDRDNLTFNFSLVVNVSFNDNTENISLFNNICKDKKTYEVFKKLANKALKVLKKEIYKEKFSEININRIYVHVDTIIPTQYVINNLIANKTISNEEIDKITNVLSNMDFSDKLSKYNFQYNNPIHKGILLDLLLKEQYDTLSPFYPLQNYPDQQDEINEITVNLENSLIDILDRTKV